MMPNSRTIYPADIDSQGCIRNVSTSTETWIIKAPSVAKFCDPINNHAHITVEAGATLNIGLECYNGPADFTLGDA